MNHTIISEDYCDLSKLTKDEIFTNHVNVFSILSDLSFPNKLNREDITLEDIAFIKNKYGLDVRSEYYSAIKFRNIKIYYYLNENSNTISKFKYTTKDESDYTVFVVIGKLNDPEFFRYLVCQVIKSYINDYIISEFKIGQCVEEFDTNTKIYLFVNEINCITMTKFIIYYYTTLFICIDNVLDINLENFNEIFKDINITFKISNILKNNSSKLKYLGRDLIRKIYNNIFDKDFGYDEEFFIDILNEIL